jgi:maleate isomerase
VQRRHFLISAALGPVAVAGPHRRRLRVQDGRWEFDGAGTVARLGVLTPDFDPVPESELWAMAPHGISVHAARVPRTGGRGAGFVAEPYADDAVARLVELAPRAILLGYTSSSYALGAAADEQVRARLQQRAKGIPLIFTCPAAAAALRQLAIRRLSLVHPPWWSEEANEQGRAYWGAAGFDVVQCSRLQPLRAFAEVTAAEVFDFVAGHTPRSAEAVFIGGNGMRAIGAIRELESSLGRPVLTANQVLLWDALRRLDKVESLQRYGSILTGP